MLDLARGGLKLYRSIDEEEEEGGEGENEGRKGVLDLTSGEWTKKNPRNSKAS